MKKVLLIMPFFFIIIHINGQNRMYKGNNVLLPSNLVISYSVPLADDNKNLIDSIVKPYYVSTQTQDIFTIILKSVLSGENIVQRVIYTDNYDIYKNPFLPIREIEQELGIPNHNGIKSNNPKKKAAKSDNIVAKDFYGLSFWEELVVTENPFSINKKVLAYSPFRKLFNREDTNKKQPLYKRAFLVLDTLENKTLKEQSDKRMILVNRIKYEYFLSADVDFFSNGQDFLSYNKLKDLDKNDSYQLVKYPSPFLCPYGIKRFINLLLDQINNYGAQAYDFQTNQPLTMEQIKRNLGITEQVISDEIRDDGTMVTKTIVNEFDPATVQSILFTEEWYIDPVTLRMQKKITAVSPVVFTYKEEDSEKQHPIRKILFTLNTNEFASN